MATETLNIDSATSQASFTVKKLGLITVKGTLKDFSGSINFDEKDLSNSSFETSLAVSTINTGTPKRDEHLKSADFFAADTYPEISFRSTAIENIGGKYQATGQLTIQDLSKEVIIPFDFKNGTFKGAFSLNRLDYNLGKKFPTFFIGNNIEIAITCKVK
ncbi:MAG: hypothetical protein Sapg2KO_02120 [Saprospiraceae bacterium]